MSPKKSAREVEPDTTKLEFGRRLQDVLAQKGWNQSDLARAAFGEDNHGNARGRDAISTYIRGVSFPEPLSLRKIADALGVQPGDLMGTSAPAPQQARAPITLRQASGDPGSVAINVDAVVSIEQASEILSILKRK
jgi:transcriptional regulator with XRE-family HTH domain